MAFRDYFGGIVSLGGSIVNGIMQGLSNRAQAKENEKNRQFAIDMFNRENEFNLPINQVARFQEAGLNSALVYGQGAQTLSAHASSPSTNNQFNAPQLDVNSALGAYFQSKQVQNETKIADATEFEKNTNANKNIAEAEYYEEQSNLLKTENQYRGKMLQIDLEKRGIELNNLDIENTIKLATQNTEIALKLTELEKLAADKEISTSEVKIKAQELLNLAEELENLKKTGEYIEAQTETEKHKQGALDAEAAASMAVAEYNHAQASLTPYQKKLLKAQTTSYFADAFMKKSSGKLNKWQAWKIANDVEEAFANGNLQRALDSINKLKGIIGESFNAANYLKELIQGHKFLPGSQRKWINPTEFKF